jgi:hypothetical protein
MAWVTEHNATPHNTQNNTNAYEHSGTHLGIPLTVSKAGKSRSPNSFAFSRNTASPENSNAASSPPSSLMVVCNVIICDVMLCDGMLCYVMLCSAMFCDVMLCPVMLCYVMLCYIMLCYVMSCHVMSYHVMS